MGYNNKHSEYFMNETRLESMREEKDLDELISDDPK